MLVEAGRRAGRAILCGLVALVGCFGLAYYLAGPSCDITGVPVAPQAPGASRAVHAQQRVDASNSEPGESLTEELLRLDGSAKRGNAQDAMRAYKLATNCELLHTLREDIARNPKREGAEQMRAALDAKDRDLKGCEEVPFKLIAERYTNLLLAAKAGVPGAAVLLFGAGPNGDAAALSSRPDDPLVVEWKNAVLELVTRDAMQGDVDALATLSLAYAQGTVVSRDTSLALAYLEAMHDVKELQTGRLSAFREQDLARFANGMSPAEVARAKAHAKEIVDTCCRKNTHR